MTSGVPDAEEAGQAAGADGDETRPSWVNLRGVPLVTRLAGVTCIGAAVGRRTSCGERTVENYEEVIVNTSALGRRPLRHRGRNVFRELTGRSARRPHLRNRRPRGIR
ncbi:MAG: hypothetical protein AVDCRST_MAG48-2595 [uncultured Friedmanniella sp.]|uniref:Uncharacterized protein n=1 Tax=uncultured Friedmanniella sp. TaxID=335381 RepID=A0A6J4L5T8_9ACTN|nr:MAG: hypothetical protein AVDCRST_MAG48-2595 [uncultured Friedmanniella sp.]